MQTKSSTADRAAVSRIADSENTTALRFITRRRVLAGGIVASTILALALTDKSPAPNAIPFAAWRADHVGLRVPDRDAAISWYTKKLDFRVVETIPHGDGMTFVFLSLPGDDSFRLELLAGPGAAERPTYTDLGASLGLSGWHHLCLRVNNVDEAVAELKRRGVTIVHEPFDVAIISSRIAFFSDPWGNVFEMRQPIT